MVHRLAVSLVFSFIVQFCIRILPGNQTILSPGGRTKNFEILNIGRAPFVFEIDEQNSSANPEEHSVLINGVDVIIYIFEILLKTKRNGTVDVLVGSICSIETDTTTYLLQYKTVFATLIFILSLKAAEFNVYCFSYLQSDSPFFCA